MNPIIEADLISIIIPSYNREHIILRAVKSILNQTYQNIELIIVDDCSTDKTTLLIREIMKKDSRVQLLVNEKNRGPNYTRNSGIRHSKGKYISLLDSDDEWVPNTVEILWNKIRTTGPKVGAVYPGIRVISKNNIRDMYPKFKGNIFKDLLMRGTIGSYPLIKREVFKKTGLFDENDILRVGGHQDYEMWVRIALYYEFDCVNEILLHYHSQVDSITYSSLIKHPFRKIKSYFYIWKKYKEYIQNDTDIYLFYCYKIFELLCTANNKKWAKKIIFIALKRKFIKIRTYYHLIYYLNKFYSPFDLLNRIHKIASQIKVWIERFTFKYSG